jgi:hypothetical protein
MSKKFIQLTSGWIPMLEKLETLPIVIDTLLALPAEFELSIDATIRSTDDDNAHTPSF